MNALDLGPLADPVDPVALRALQERRELLRIASVRALHLHAQIGHLDTQSLGVALYYATQEPLQAPLGTSEPGGVA
jgi:hypothetical protein